MNDNQDAAVMPDTINETSHPGAQLKQARIEKKMSQREVANKLFLSTRVIIDLESGNFDKVGAFTFVKGYMRLYARLVGLPETPLMAAFDGLGLREERNEGSERRPAARVQITARSLRWLTCLITVFLMVLVGLWWHSKDQNNILINPVSQQHTVYGDSDEKGFGENQNILQQSSSVAGLDESLSTNFQQEQIYDARPSLSYSVPITLPAETIIVEETR